MGKSFNVCGSVQATNDLLSGRPPTSYIAPEKESQTLSRPFTFTYNFQRQINEQMRVEGNPRISDVPKQHVNCVSDEAKGWVKIETALCSQ